MARKNSNESYQRVQEAKARSRARTGGAKVTSSPLPLPPPSSQNLGTPSQPIVIPASASSQPSPPLRPSPEPEKKKRMDDVSIRNHLTILAEKSIRAAGIFYPPAPEVVTESDLKTRGQRIIESPPRQKDVPSSSRPLGASSPTPMDTSLPGSDGAPTPLPDSGGDPTTPFGPGGDAL
nr:alpha carbonic anhydrase 8-like [Arachis hypogaea]